jgi:4-hydroxybutyrate dehydrogenase/sulfolactaldehyde 3-reductase
MNVGFIGLGTMGLGMARNVVGGGHTVIGYDTNAEAVEQHVRNGGRAASSAGEAAREVDLLITMLPNGAIVEDVLFGSGAAVDNLKAGALVVDMSTIHPLETDRIRQRLAERGHSMVDAPLGRTSRDAVAGTSLIMAGGTPGDLETCRPVFECIGDTIIDCGGPGTGSRVKIVNNFMTTTLNVLTAETLRLAESIGLDLDTAIEVMSGTPAVRSHMTTTYPAKVLKGDLTPAFMIDLAKKDLDIAIDLAANQGVPLTMGEAAVQAYRKAQADGRGRQDWTALFDLLRKTTS